MKPRAALLLIGVAIVVARPLPSYAACHIAAFKDTSVTVEPEDYRARSGELTFSVGDDREETISIPIIDDELEERRERFEVRLSPGDDPGNITPSDTPAVVTIRDDDEPAVEPSDEPTPTESESPVDPTAEPTDGASPTDSPEGSPTAEGSPSPTESPLTEPAGGTSAGLIAGILAALVAAGGGIWWFLIRKPATG